MTALRRLAREGHRVRILTSTVHGLDVFPVEIPDARLDWQSDKLTLPAVVQSRDNTAFPRTERTKQFSLYTLLPVPSPSSEVPEEPRTEHSLAE
jgi:hypothetical protein